MNILLNDTRYDIAYSGNKKHVWFQRRVNGDVSYTSSLGAWVVLWWSYYKKDRGNLTISKGVLLVTFSLIAGERRCKDEYYVDVYLDRWCRGLCLGPCVC